MLLTIFQVESEQAVIRRMARYTYLGDSMKGIKITLNYSMILSF